MAAEIEADDLITDGALRRPMDLADAFEAAEKQLDILLSTINKHEKASEEQAATIAKLLKRVDLLEKEQKTLAETNKKLTQEIIKNKKATEQQSDAMEALDNRVGGAITRFKTLGKELLAIAKNPIVIVLAVIIGLFAALASSVKTFFAATGEGEDILDRQKAVWGQFFAVLKKGWSEVGKSLADAMGEQGSQKGINGLFTAAKFAFPFLSGWLNKLQADFNATATEAVKLANKMDALADRSISNLIVEAKTRRDVNKLILDSQDKIQFSDEERLKFREQAADRQEAQMRVNLSLAKAEAEGVLLSIGHEHALTDARIKSMTAEQRASEFTEEENRKLAEAMVKVIEVEGNYYQEVKKNANAIIALKQEIYREDLKRSEAAIVYLTNQERKAMDTEIYYIREKVREGKKLESAGDKEIAEIKQRYLFRMQAKQLDLLKQLLNAKQLEADDEIRIREEIYKLESELDDKTFERRKAHHKDELEILQDIQKAYQSYAGNINSIFQGITDKKIQELDKQQTANDEQLERELKGAGDNEVAKEKIEERFAKRQEQLEKQRVQLLRRAAVFEKAIAIAQATINTAVAVTALLETPPLAIAAGIAGALEIAAILAQPLPAYAEGTDGHSHKGGLAVVGEEGTELYRTPDGQLGLTANHASIMNLPKGTEVLPHDETMKALAMAGMGMDTLGSREDAMLLQAFISGLGKLNHTIKNKREVRINFSKRGAEAAILNAHNNNKFLGEFYA